MRFEDTILALLDQETGEVVGMYRSLKDIEDDGWNISDSQYAHLMVAKRGNENRFIDMRGAK